MNKIVRLEKDIRLLNIQGATNVAYTVFEGIKIGAEYLRQDSSIKPFKYLKEIAIKLAFARPTEPLAQNAVRYIFAKPDQNLEFYLNKKEEFKRLIEQAKEEIVTASLPIIENGGVYLTHCHSSTVIKMFIKARKEGKRFSVYATETRPRYQGRTTVKELLKAGFEDVTLIIDDVVQSMIEGRLKHLDGVFIGADLLSEDGFVNKVGSLGIAYAANRTKVPFYSLSALLKYDPRKYSPDLVEQRSGMEIWSGAPKNLNFYAPAFDYIPYSTGVWIICEEGIISGNEVKPKAVKLYPVCSLL